MAISLLISSLTALVSAMDRKNVKLNTDIASLNRFREQYTLLPTTYMKLRNFLKYNLRETDEKEFEFFQLLPRPVRDNLVNMMQKEKVTRINFLKEREKDLLALVAPKLRYLRISKGEEIFNAGNLAESIYFIAKGSVGYYLSKHDSNAFIVIPTGNSNKKLKLKAITLEKKMFFITQNQEKDSFIISLQ
jgi:hypothetical protein